MTTAALFWAGITLAAAAVGVRGGRSPIDRPAPAAVAAASMFAAATAAAGLSRGVQAATFVVATAGLAGLLWRWRVLIAEDNLAPGVGGNRLLGRTATVLTPVDAEGVSGTVRLGTERWPATAAAPTVLAAGSTVTVVGVEGIHLLVEAVPDGPQPADERDPATSDPGGPLCA